MTEVPKPLGAAMDLFVYAPVGLALTAAEELPKLAAKGRTRVEGQVAIARIVGQFAVTRGRQELEKRFGGTPGGGSPASAGPAGGSAEPAGSVAAGVSTGPAAGSGGSAEPAAARRSTAPGPSSANGAGPSSGSRGALPGTEVVHASRSVTVSTAGDVDGLAGGEDPMPTDPDADFPLGVQPSPPAKPAAAPEASELAIPGYDSLSASQVVQRLAGLERNELESVAAYEGAHRGRRTILNRIQQLTGG